MPKTLVLSDREIAPSFLIWATNQRESGVRLICVEGLPVSGKSWLLQNSLDANFRVIELDCFLKKPAPDTISWVEQVRAGGLASSHARGRDSRAVSRASVLLEKMSKSGGVIDWLDGDGLLEHAAGSNAYWRSIYEHHGTDRPWLSADLVYERVPEE